MSSRKVVLWGLRVCRRSREPCNRKGKETIQGRTYQCTAAFRFAGEYGRYFATLKYGDTIMSMDLSHGGHLSHGSPVNFSGKLFKIVPYGVSRQTKTIDYDELSKIAKEHKPKIIVAGASAYPRELDFKRFREIADEAGAMLLADIAHIA